MPKFFEQPKQQEKSTLENLKNNVYHGIRKTVTIMGTATFMFTTGIGGSTSILKAYDYFKFKNERENLDKEIENLGKENAYKRLEYYYGTHFEDMLINGNSNVEAHVHNLDQEKVSPRIENLPSFNILAREGVENQMDSLFMSKVLNETFPKNWVKGEVSYIKYNPIHKPMEYPGFEGEGNEAWASFNKSTSEITFYQPVNQHSSYENINKCLTHELGHANDWMSDNETSIGEKIDLLLGITDRLNSADRYQSQYVESIGLSEKSIMDKWVTFTDNKEFSAVQEQRYTKATEYWAEICAEYFSNPEILNYKDFKLVDDWVKKNDANFDHENASRDRSNLIFENDYGSK